MSVLCFKAMSSFPSNLPRLIVKSWQVLGDSVMASCVLGRLSSDSIIVGAFGWGLAVTVSVAIACGVSGMFLPFLINFPNFNIYIYHFILIR